ncbi:hypothetical protein C8J56DRAFT_1077886, partial [Mycena floridula]
ITGVVNCQCAHVFVLSTVDLQYGERFTNSDFALKHAICRRRYNRPISWQSGSDEVTSYDCVCQFCVHVCTRFGDKFKDLVEVINCMRWCIPALHVQNHKDACMYLFAAAYMKYVGHFHGETAEHYWPEFNQLGPHVKQMNGGHRQDTIIDHHSDWNWKKMMQMYNTLYDEITLAKSLYIQKRDHFLSLSKLFESRIPTWTQHSREPRLHSGSEIESVYHYRRSKLPSQNTIYQETLAQEVKMQQSQSKPSGNWISVFLHEALDLQASQRHLKKCIQSDLGLITQPEVEKQRANIQVRLLKLRRDQKEVMPTVGDAVLEASRFSHLPEDENLCLPSDFDHDSRISLGLDNMAKVEVKFREGQAFDSIRVIQSLSKALSVLQADKKKQESGQIPNMRSGDKIRDLEYRQHLAIDDYNVARGYLIKLHVLSVTDMNSSFPKLTIQDTYRKPVMEKRSMGDSRRSDGALYHMGSTGLRARAAPILSISPITFGVSGLIHPFTGGKRQKLEHLPSDLSSKNTAGPNPITEDGWIWNMAATGKMTEQEYIDWQDEGDSVQWFRAEAEMERWQEQLEIKQAEFLRCIDSFKMMSRNWNLIAEHSERGARAYARQKSAMYSQMERQCRDQFGAAGYGVLLEDDAPGILEYINQQR